MPSRPAMADSPPKAKAMSHQRRRFSIYQRGQEVTVGPLGFDVPINGDKTAFPSDEVDEEDRLSGVEYPSSDDYEREVKRRRIERNARDYLCGRRLNLYSTTLRGPLEKSYWGQKAKVVGTPLEIVAEGLKKDVIRGQRRRSEALADIRSLTTSPKVPIRRDKGHRITLSQKLLSQQRNEEPSIVDSQPSIGVTSTPIHYPSSPLQTSKNATPETGKSARLLLATADSVRTTKVRLNKHSQEESIVPATSPRNKPNQFTQMSSQSSFIDLTGGGEASGLLLDDATVFDSDYTSPLVQKLKPQAKTQINGKSIAKNKVERTRSRSAEAGASELRSSQIQGHSTLNIDLDRLGQISKELGIDDSGLLDDTTNFFRNEIGPRHGRDQSPATTLKISLPKFGTRNSHKGQAPTSPTADAALRKALKPAPVHRRRSDLGHSVSMNDMIARTAASSKILRRPKQRSCEDQGVQDPTPHKLTSSLPLKNCDKSSPPVEEQHVGTAQREQPPGLMNALALEEIPDKPGEAGDEDEDTDMVPESPIEKSMSSEPMPGLPETVTQPPMRLSQMPTPLPPSPLALLSHTKQATPNIPETVVEEAIEKPPVDVAVKENEPTFRPGPRPKKFGTKAKLGRLTALKNSSVEEEKPQVSLHDRKIATPVSRLRQKMAEFSPISPMPMINDVSPMAESQPTREIHKSGIRLQERLKDGQHKRSSQLSSPPPSSPPEARAPAVTTVPSEESYVEVPATSKEATTAEPSPTTDNPEIIASGAPPSPPQEPREAEEEESTLEISSSRYRKIEESLNNGVSEAIPLALVEETISHISATHPESSAGIADANETEVSLNLNKEISENPPVDITEKILESVPSTAIPPIDNDPVGPGAPGLAPIESSPKQVLPTVPRTPPAGTQTSHVSIPESFKKAIAAPINYRFTSPAAPLPPPFLPSTGFTPINTEQVLSSPGSTKIISPASSRVDLTLGPFFTTENDIEFTPFRAIRSPEQPKKTRTQSRSSIGDAIGVEGTEPISPFTFSQFMKPVESQYQVSPAKVTGVAALVDDKPSSYDLENVLGGVEDFLMSDVYDVDEEAKRLSENPSFGESGGNTKSPQKEDSKRKSQRRY
ncbi:hypothetical protein AOL_s00215g789 [Orbilia oligospora ATCC 24927]|uniref:Uncharacterized protein n=1 Tax=Arthrobotrys oligospora (strain ATCC 24927 / CBS 115.81 / DSM 1491) TaxID=756982 RepID=G1XUY1_ARTOA|nr:hypothetical protein AOL_s00215g789 [Orbilia oligospora ATCC 24927]EGX43003.1 hypothetical protein AOL_s00215g789 [Orbilia oligospora ATCC 24927]